MKNLAQTYSALGRYSEALAMFESVLEFAYRIPGNTPDLGEGHRSFPFLSHSIFL